jgi:hypothetical protein
MDGEGDWENDEAHADLIVRSHGVTEKGRRHGAASALESAA